MQGLIARKMGMEQVYDAQGRRVGVTVLEVGPCVVVQRKTLEKDGYDAAQVGFMEQKPHRVSKPELGRFTKAGVPPMKHVREFRLQAGEDVKAGDKIAVGAVFEGVTHVDITGVTKGRGFQGVVKRHRMAGGPAAHGSMSHRRIGAIGQRAKPGNISKGHRMPGHMGNVTVTVQNLRIVEIRPDRNQMLVEGAVPGPRGGIVYVRRALKKSAAKSGSGAKS